MADSASSEKGQPLCKSIASTVLDLFHCLPKTGKAQSHEHTVLAGHNSHTLAVTLGHSDCCSFSVFYAGFVVGWGSARIIDCQVVALGTGTKCLSAQKRTCQVSQDILSLTLFAD